MMEKLKEILKDKKTLTVIALVLLMILTVGITYALFTYSRAGEKVNSLSTGTVTMSYNEATNGLSITNALPVEDCTGEKSTDTFDFTMSITMKGNFTISYEVTAEKDEASTLSDDDVRIYLERSEDGTTYEAVSGPNSYTMIGNEDEFGASANEMILDSGTVTKSVDYKYKLRMWLSKNAEVTGESKYFTIKVNVYGKDGEYDSSAYGRDELLNEDTKDECNNNTKPTITPVNKVKEYCELDENKDKASCKAPSSCTDGSCNDDTIDGGKDPSDTSDDACTYTMAYDGTSDNNLRYTGKNPCNYVKFNNELWRIVGSFANISNGTTSSKRIKLVKNGYAYTGTAFDSNNSNDYSTSTLKTTLNGTYYNGLTTDAKNMIDNAAWNIGGFDPTWDAETGSNAANFYAAERSSTVNSGHATTWTGKVGLMYPSDYLYGTSGSSSVSRATCLSTPAYGKNSNWYASGGGPCAQNDYLFDSSHWQWTITPYSGISDDVFGVGNYGLVSSFDAGYTYSIRGVRPAVFLKSSISISGGSGTASDPYTLGDTGSSTKEDDNATHSVDLKSSIQYIKSYKEEDGKKIPQYAYKSSKTLEPAGSVDVYINGNKVKEAVSEYHGEFKKGTKYKFVVRDSEMPYTYEGVASGVLEGTVGSKNVVTKLKYRFNRCKITYDPNDGKFTNNLNTTVQYMKYGDTTHAENDTLRNANGGHFAAVRSGYTPKTGAEWKCSGKACAQDTYDETKKYKATELCNDLQASDESITLKVNWVKD